MGEPERVEEREMVLKPGEIVKGESVESEGWVERIGNPGEMEGAVQT